MMEWALISKSRISDSRTVCWLQNVRNKNCMVCLREDLPTESASACYVRCGGTSEESTSIWGMRGCVWGLPKEAASTRCVWEGFLRRGLPHALYWGRFPREAVSLHAAYWWRIPIEVASTCCVLVGGLLRETPPQVVSATPSSLAKNTSTFLATVTYFSTEQCLPNWMVTIDL